MSEDKHVWHQLLRLSEEDFDKIELINLRSYPVYYCMRADGRIELWPKPIGPDFRNLSFAWSF